MVFRDNAINITLLGHALTQNIFAEWQGDSDVTEIVKSKIRRRQPMFVLELEEALLALKQNRPA
jgi:hypothetical protein